jgi:hypothetical protein
MHAFIRPPLSTRRDAWTYLLCIAAVYAVGRYLIGLSWLANIWKLALIIVWSNCLRTLRRQGFQP